VDALITIFREVRDPRDFNARHDCAAMLLIALIATLCGAKTCVGYADFASANLQYLAEVVDLPYGAPSHDCFSRLFRLLDPAQMERALQVFARTLRRALGLEPISKVIVCDGKRMKRGYERGRSFMPPLMISVWDTETRLSIAARASSDGNEVAATLEVLQTLVLKGSWVLADALHCHPQMAADIRAKGGHYALKLKGNNAPLFGCANRAFAKAEAKGGLTFHMTEEKGHDRLERRLASVVMAPADAPNLPGLVMFGRIESERQVAAKKPSFYTHYVALSKAVTPKTMLNLVRSYWGVENNCHWQLDVAFNEDGCRTRKGNGAKNISIIRRIGLDILRTHPLDMSIQRKTQLAAWNVEFRDELYTHLR
jgi:predicted transposase YbfD/YdcC